MSGAPDRSPSVLPKLFGLAFITGFSGAIMPGPLLVAVIGQTVLQGLRGVVGLITGHALLELVTVALLAMGLQAMLGRPRVRGAIGLLGGAGLAWMGFDMVRSVPHLTLDLGQAGTQVYSWPQLIVWGAAVCAANPYFTAWWATVGAGQLATMVPRTVPEYLSFYLGHEASDFSWYLIVGLIIVTGRNWLTDDIYHGLIYACGIVIALLGIAFIYTGLRSAFGARQGEEVAAPAD
jgi:threonine/homoserine/homoserine lactone efflux protein